MVLKGGCPPDVANQTQGPGSARRSYARKWPLGRRNRAARGGWSEKANEIEVSATPICNTRCYMCPSDVAIAHLTFQFTLKKNLKYPLAKRRGVVIYYLSFWVTKQSTSELNSVGRVPPCQGGCRGFESRSSLQKTKCDGGVAQLVEQVTLNHWVQGSNPCAPTIQPHDCG